MKSIYRYTDSRVFLKERYLERKEDDAKYSFQKFSRDAGIKSPNYLKLVMDGDRNLTNSNIQQFAKALGLAENELEYFECMVQLTQSDSDLERKFYQARLRSLKKNKIANQGAVKFKSLAQSPFLPAILVSANGIESQDADFEISRKFGLPRGLVKDMLERLIDEKILERAETRLRLTEDYYVQFDRLKSNEDQKKFLKAQLDLSAKALETRYAVDAQFFAHTFTTSPDRVPDMVKRFASLLEEVTNESNDDPPDRAMQINIQFFPLNAP